jgi:beta-galactosidase
LVVLQVRAETNANDHIFPAASAAKRSIDFDSRGFLINGERTFIVSAGMEYARVPRELWRDPLLRLKRAGFNTVEMYTFWNFHEPQEGKFDFSGDHDLDAFLKLLRQMDMYAIVRVGPYYCAEWTMGGYPLWLRSKPGLLVRQPNVPFETYVDRFFDKLIPIVAANQINRGGSVILVQLENEHPQGWGTVMPNAYFTHLRDKALSLGIEVPYFFSGLHHANDPAGNAGSLDDPTRPNPWLSTEFWSVWFDHYGPQPSDARVYGRRTWKIIAHGGNGYNVYMAHGGSDFDYTNSNEDAASYDYGAAVGQAGDLRPMYYSFKAAAWFPRSFENILENSVDATVGLAAKVSNPVVKLTARHSPSGTILFLDNPTDNPQLADLESTGDTSPRSAHFLLAPSEIVPVISQAELTDGVTLGWSASRVLGVASAGMTTTLVIYGPPGSTAELDFATKLPSRPLAGEASFHRTSEGLQLSASFNAGDPLEYSFSTGTRRIRVLALDQARVDDTWFVDQGSSTYVVSGVPYVVGDASITTGHLQFMAERPWQASSSELSAVGYGAAAMPLRFVAKASTAAHPSSLQTGPWLTASASAAATGDYDDSSWTQSESPQQMGTDGDLAPEAWYRTTVNVADTSTQLLHIEKGGDRAALYIDGIRKQQITSRTPNFQFSVNPGKHSIAIFTAENGRDKLYNHLGALSDTDVKGLQGVAVLWTDASTQPLTWRAAPAQQSGNPPQQSGNEQVPPDPNSPAWQDDSSAAGVPGAGATPNRPVATWLQTTIKPSPGHHQLLQFPGAGPNLPIYLNEKPVARQSRPGNPLSLSLDTASTGNSPAVVTMLVRGRGGRGGFDREVRLISYKDETPVTAWRMRGGSAQPSSSDWHAMRSEDRFEGPQFFRTEFIAPPVTSLGPHPMWRVVVAGMGHGSVWVNGHNLGIYPERIPINGLYIPECWLQAKNTLVIYDQDGRTPEAVTIQSEPAASLDVLRFAVR